MSSSSVEHKLKLLQLQIILQWLLIGGLFWARANPKLQGPATQDLIPKTAKAQQFVLVGSDGRELACLGAVDGLTPSLVLKDDSGRTVCLGSESSGTESLPFFGLKIEEESHKSNVSVGLAAPEAPLSHQFTVGLSIVDANSQSIHLDLDAEHRRPSLLLGDAKSGFIDLGIWFVDQRPYLKLIQGGKLRASLSVPPGSEGSLLFAKPTEALRNW